MDAGKDTGDRRARLPSDRGGLGLLVDAQQLGLQLEDVVQHAVGAPALHAVVGDQAGLSQLQPQPAAQLCVDADLAAGQGVLQQLQAEVQGGQTALVCAVDAHVEPTSTRPAFVSRTWIRGSGGSGYDSGDVIWKPSVSNATL